MLRKWFPFWIVPFLLVFSVATVGLRLSLVKTTYSINQAEKKIRELRIEKSSQEIRLSSLRSPKRLEALARTQFSLSPPRADQVIPMPITPDAGGAP